uniref:CD48 antigen n=1 Tax=Jaculus jaculus TaxID=51337 RepID=A0A8C5JXE9_JACJA
FCFSNRQETWVGTGRITSTPHITCSNTTLQIFKRQLTDCAHLTWLYTTKQKILEWDGVNTKYFNSTFKDRVMLDSQTPALHIYNVRKEDSGPYYLRVLRNRTEEQEMITLQVMDPVPKPLIKIEKTEMWDDACFLKLSCVIESQTVYYTWYGDSGPFPEELERGVLEVTVNPQNQSRFYTCQVSNLVSSRNDTVYFTPPCALARSSGGAWTAAWLIIMTSLILVCLLT